MKSTLGLIVFLIAFYFMFTWAFYMDFKADPYGYWHFLTRSNGWVNDYVPGSGSLHWLFPYDKAKEEKYYKEHFSIKY